jgi:Domain of unknown function (DUF4440)
MPRFLVPFWYALLISFTCSAAQNQAEQSPSQLPPSTDIDPTLTEQFRQIEQQFADAILHKDSGALERFVGPEYALRISDVPQSSLPRAIWMDNSLHRLQAESVEQRDYAARKLTDDLAVVSVSWTYKGSMDGRDFSGDSYLVDLWKKHSGDWQIIGRYGCATGKPPDRPPLQLPPPADIDPALTEQFRQLEQELGEVALNGFKDTRTVERLVAPEFTLRMSDAPGRSIPRNLWGQPSSTYKIESLEERYHAARKLTDDLSVVSLLVTQKATVDGCDRSGDFYLVDIWRKRGDHWQMIARYSCPMQKNV